MYKNIILLIISLFITNSCQSSVDNLKPISKNIENISNDKKIYQQIYKSILSKNMDDADDFYIKLKTTFDNSNYTNKAALDLAIVHMQRGEHILANFYLQDYLAQDASSEFAKFLLVKNQFLSAVRNQRDQSYINRALNALKVNKDLVVSSDYQLLANSMLTRVKLDITWQNREIGNLYKSLKKEEASKIYQDKINQLGVNINDIYKP